MQGVRPTPPLPPEAVEQAVQAVLAPLVRLLLGAGVDYTRCAADLKRVFVQEARREIERAGHAATDSALSLLSGVHRKDLRSFREAGDAPAAKAVPIAAQVYARWAADPAYGDDKGRPRPLPRTGAKPSFESLVRELTQDVHPFTVLQELTRLGIVSAMVEPTQELEMVLPAPQYVPPAGSQEALQLLAANLGDHAQAAVSNLQGGEPMLEQSVYAAGITEASARQLEQLARELWAQSRARLIEQATQYYQADQDRPDARSRVRFGGYFWADEWEPPTPPAADPKETGS